MVAVSQRYEELNENVRIHWDKRTLDEFGHKPIDQLIKEYDLIVIDHPWAGFCFDRALVYDLKSLLTKEQECELGEIFMGRSFESYSFDNKLLAIPIDMAAPVPSWRPDLMAQHNLPVPETWEDLIALADKKQAVMPGFGADLFLNWLMLLHALDAKPFESKEHVADKDKAMEAAMLLKRLAEPMPGEMVHWNPILIAEMMTQTDRYAYCPFAYSYGNYSRPSFVRNPLQYGNLIQLNGTPLKSILGGTGIAISSRCTEVDLALDFSLYCANPDIQSTIYTYSGGQPVHKEAWKDKKLTLFSGGFFGNSYLSHEAALIRPRYDGFVPLQKKAGNPLQQFILGEISEHKLWDILEKYFHESHYAGIRP